MSDKYRVLSFELIGDLARVFALLVLRQYARLPCGQVRLNKLTFGYLGHGEVKVVDGRRV
ncbi:hypothetical protein GCM10009304_03460 [Pseudomonas matsuisoli]|uniref:Uncharacterized protein n=1 Tax=Pseudomonas matsuisoli TaxID=1515666 RepID=A0A917PJD3_9PSED|nr:hypothetical protein GCM10009304_03460 [Pseudomonas matsuisoli]